MVNIKGFKALRPNETLVNKVAALPYDVLNREEAKRITSKNKFSFLNVDKAETNFEEEVDEYSEKVYHKARKNLECLINSGTLIKEGKDCLYIYELEWNGKVQRGLVTCLSVDDYLNNTIKKHEFTRPKKEEDRINHIKYCEAQTGPIFLTYRDDENINYKISSLCRENPLYDFKADDGVVHKVWRIEDEDLINKLIGLFINIESVYIADGHHRSEAAVKICLEKRKGESCSKEDECNYFLGVLFPKSQLNIIDYNRVVKDLNGLSNEEFLTEVKEKFNITKLEEGKRFKPSKKGEFGMYLNNSWFRLEYKVIRDVENETEVNSSIKNAFNEKIKENNKKEESLVEQLDVSILQNNILEPILGIKDLRNDERIDFVGGIRGLEELEKRVSEDMKVAFALYPTSLDEVMEISDKGLIMPPKSTWFEPKLRSGIFIHEI